MNAKKTNNKIKLNTTKMFSFTNTNLELLLEIKDVAHIAQEQNTVLAQDLT